MFGLFEQQCHGKQSSSNAVNGGYNIYDLYPRAVASWLGAMIGSPTVQAIDFKTQSDPVPLSRYYRLSRSVKVIQCHLLWLQLTIAPRCSLFCSQLRFVWPTRLRSHPGASACCVVSETAFLFLSLFQLRSRLVSQFRLAVCSSVSFRAAFRLVRPVRLSAVGCVASPLTNCISCRLRVVCTF